MRLIEEHRYHSSGMGEVRDLSLRILVYRLNAFYKVVKAANRSGALSKKTRDRMGA